MDNPIPDPIGRVLRRRLIDKAHLREDLRRMALVFIGGGALGIAIEGASTSSGFVAIGAGAICWALGLTERRS